MYTILKKRNLAPEINAFIVNAPLIAERAQAGHFVMLRLTEQGERIPLTIADWDRQAGTIMLVCQTFGKTSGILNSLEAGDEILDLLGPLGTPIEVKKYGTVVLLGGGVGIPAILSKAKELKPAGNIVISIIGARCKELLILKEEMEEASHKLYLTTDDGSSGHKGFVTDVLAELMAEDRPDLVISVGPVPMMKATVSLTKARVVPCIVSLNPIMVDGTGMCGSCRVTVDGQTKFACVDGPSFFGEAVDFDELSSRQNFYRQEEALAREGEHKCQCGR